MAGLKHPVTPDGRYFVVRGRLWRLANSNLSPEVRSALVSELMRAVVQSARLPFLFAFVGISGGLAAFGLIGLFLGPAILAALLTVWRERIFRPAEKAS